MIKHPATYTNSFIPKFAEMLIGCENVLDIFGGIGKLALIKEHGFTGKVICNELEREWAETSPHNVDEWHKEALTNFGMKLIDEIKIETPRMGFGQNAKSRVQHECILVFKYYA